MVVFTSSVTFVEPSVSRHSPMGDGKSQLAAVDNAHFIIYAFEFDFQTNLYYTNTIIFNLRKKS